MRRCPYNVAWFCPSLECEGCDTYEAELEAERNCRLEQEAQVNAWNRREEELARKRTRDRTIRRCGRQ